MGPLLVPLIAGGIQAGVGALQRRAARKRREKALSEFSYDIPSAVTEQLQMAKERASRRGLPGEDITRSRMDSELAQTVSKGESVAESAGDILGLYAKSYGQKTDTTRRFLEGGAQYQAQRESELDKSMQLMADAEAQQFHYNRYLPFMSEMGYAGEEAQGGSANIASGLQTAYSGWANNWMMGKMEGLYNNDKDTQISGLLNKVRNQSFAMPQKEKPLALEPWMTNENIWGTQ